VPRTGTTSNLSALPSALSAQDDPALDGDGSVSLRLEGFAWESIQSESERLGVGVEELVGFAVMYYLADLDSGRIARRISPSADPEGTGGDLPR